MGFHGPGELSEGKQTRQGLYPARIAAVTVGNETRLAGFVLRPGGQLTRQYTLVVLQALMESRLVSGTILTAYFEPDTSLLLQSPLRPICGAFS